MVVLGSVDYVLKASKGQHMRGSMATDNGASYFNILEPGENEVAAPAALLGSWGAELAPQSKTKRNAPHCRAALNVYYCAAEAAVFARCIEPFAEKFPA